MCVVVVAIATTPSWIPAPLPFFHSFIHSFTDEVQLRDKRNTSGPSRNSRAKRTEPVPDLNDFRQLVGWNGAAHTSSIWISLTSYDFQVQARIQVQVQR